LETTIADKLTGKVVGEPYRGKPEVRYDEGAEGRCHGEVKPLFIYDDHFSRQFGFWRPYLEKVIYRYLDCGNLSNGFARVKCKDCGHGYLLPFTCRRHRFQNGAWEICQRPNMKISEMAFLVGSLL
jgi:hypothetical protein